MSCGNLKTIVDKKEARLKVIGVTILSFRKVERTAKGTLLVSSLVQNLFSNNTLTDYG